MLKKFEGGTLPQENKKDRSTNFNEFLPIVERITGRPLEELQKTFGETWHDEKVGVDLLRMLEIIVIEYKKWIDQGEKGGFSTLEEGKSKLVDYEAVIETLKARQVAELLKRARPDLCADPVKLEDDLNKRDKQIQELEKAEDGQSKEDVQMLKILRNADAYLLDKKLIKEEYETRHISPTENEMEERAEHIFNKIKRKGLARNMKEIRTLFVMEANLDNDDSLGKDFPSTPWLDAGDLYLDYSKSDIRLLIVKIITKVGASLGGGNNGFDEGKKKLISQFEEEKAYYGENIKDLIKNFKP